LENPFYQKYVTPLERIDEYFTNKTNQSYMGFPTVNSTTIFSKDCTVNLDINNQTDAGLVVNIDERKCHQYVDKIFIGQISMILIILYQKKV
jgi:hypothetical protein